MKYLFAKTSLNYKKNIEGCAQGSPKVPITGFMEIKITTKLRQYWYQNWE